MTQFHLQSWPVDGGPNETTPTISLIERSRKHWRDTGYSLIAVQTTPRYYDSYNNPTTHCYAHRVGSEATGVYCGLCGLFRQLEVEDSVNVFTTVCKLRKQRPAILSSKVMLL